MSRIFQLRLLGEHQATFIVADTDEDAIAQAREAKKATGKIVMSFFDIAKQPKHRLDFEKRFFLNARNRKTAPSHR